MSSQLPHDYPPPEIPDRDPWREPQMPQPEPWMFDDVQSGARRYAFPIAVIAVTIFLAVALLLQFDFFGGGSDDLEAEELELLAERARAARAGINPTEGGIGVSIYSEPDGALVYLNSEPVGITPLIDHPVAAGVVTVSLRKFDFAPRDTVVLVDRDHPGSYHFRLRAEDFGGFLAENSEAQAEGSARVPEADRNQSQETVDLFQAPPRSALPTGPPRADRNPTPTGQSESGQVSDTANEALATILAPRGTVQVIVRPWGTIYIDDVLHVRDTDVMYTASLAPGTHRVTAVHPSLGTLNKSIDVVSGEKHPVVFDFNKTYSVTVTSTPTFGEIIVNGRPTGFYTPQRLQLPVGRHRIEVKREGYSVMGGVRDIEIQEDITEPVAFELVEANS